MKANIVWSIIWKIIVIVIVLAFMLPAWANAQDGARDTTPDPLSGYKDWLWGVLAQGVRVHGGSDCQKTATGKVCSYDFTVEWAPE